MRIIIVFPLGTAVRTKRVTFCKALTLQMLSKSVVLLSLIKPGKRIIYMALDMKRMH